MPPAARRPQYFFYNRKTAKKKSENRKTAKKVSENRKTARKKAKNRKPQTYNPPTPFRTVLLCVYKLVFFLYKCLCLPVYVNLLICVFRTVLLCAYK